MKITQELHAQLEAASKKERPLTKNNHSFQRIVQSQSVKLKHEELERLMVDINKQGERLVRYRSFRDLAKFKRLVKGFLEEAVSSGLDLNQSHSFNYVTGQSRRLTIVKEVDEKLLELTEKVLNEEKKAVDLLGIIGEIKGLLVHLYI